jgi:hypothetical protein
MSAFDPKRTFVNRGAAARSQFALDQSTGSGASVKNRSDDDARRLVMLSKHNVAARLLAVSTLATLSLATVAEAQMYGQGPGQGGGGMMGGGWGWGMGYGMGGYGGIGVLVLALVVLGIAFVAFRRRSP